MFRESALVAEAGKELKQELDELVVGTFLINGLVVDAVFERLVVALAKEVSAEFVIAV